MTFASVRNPHPAPAESAPTTFSFRHLDARTGSRTGRKPQNTDESSRIFLVVAVAHCERRKIGAIQRVVRMPAYNRDVALVQREGDGPSHIVLRSLDESIQRLSQR